MLYICVFSLKDAKTRVIKFFSENVRTQLQVKLQIYSIGFSLEKILINLTLKIIRARLPVITVLEHH